MIQATQVKNAVAQNGVLIARTPTGIAVAWSGGILLNDGMVRVEVSYQGRRLKDLILSILTELPWRDYYIDVDMLKVCVRVLTGTQVLAELGLPPEDTILPFMVRQGEQSHVTENYISVPPALHLTDGVGAVWTLGFKMAPKELSPGGEFAFPVLRDGVYIGEIASRLELKNGRVRVFTKDGWKQWSRNGREFF